MAVCFGRLGRDKRGRFKSLGKAKRKSARKGRKSARKGRSKRGR